MSLSISEVAAGAGVNIQTVRYYERRGLLPEAPRSRAGYRQYEDDTVARIRFIKRSQQLGFQLEEIGELLDLRIEHGDACAAVEARAMAKIDTVDGKIRELNRIRVVLSNLVEACEVRAPTGDCPILASLSEEE